MPPIYASPPVLSNFPSTAGYQVAGRYALAACISALAASAPK